MTEPLFKYDNERSECLYQHGYQSVRGWLHVRGGGGASLASPSIRSPESGRLARTPNWLLAERPVPSGSSNSFAWLLTRVHGRYLCLCVFNYICNRAAPEGGVRGGV